MRPIDDNNWHGVFGVCAAIRREYMAAREQDKTEGYTASRRLIRASAQLGTLVSVFAALWPEVERVDLELMILNGDIEVFIKGEVQ